MFSVVLRILQLLVAYEPLVRFRCGFQQNVPLQNEHLNHIENRKSHVRLQTDFPRSHHKLGFKLLKSHNWIDSFCHLHSKP